MPDAKCKHVHEIESRLHVELNLTPMLHSLVDRAKIGIKMALNAEDTPLTTEASATTARAGPAFISQIHGDVLVSIISVCSVELNPATRLDLAVADCPVLLKYGTMSANLPRTSIEYIAREQMLVRDVTWHGGPRPRPRPRQCPPTCFPPTFYLPGSCVNNSGGTISLSAHNFTRRD